MPPFPPSSLPRPPSPQSSEEGKDRRKSAAHPSLEIISDFYHHISELNPIFISNASICHASGLSLVRSPKIGQFCATRGVKSPIFRTFQREWSPKGTHGGPGVFRSGRHAPPAPQQARAVPAGAGAGAAGAEAAQTGFEQQRRGQPRFSTAGHHGQHVHRAL
eukprot:scaffold7041_cov311-Pinguiococcus_pyrenoidosus.AAC.12